MSLLHKPVDRVGTFETSAFSRWRNPTIDTLRWGRKRHHIPILLEIDVTAARAAIHDRKTKTGQRISFTGWLVKCIAQAVSEHKQIHALRSIATLNSSRTRIIHDEIAVREYVGLTVLFDHDVADGAPVGRFIRRLQKLMVDRYGLEE